MCLGINGYRKAFVYTEAVDIQHSQGHAREALDLAKDVRSPLPQAVLYKCEL